MLGAAHRGPQTAKRRGTTFEHHVRQVLEAQGWRVVRSAGSLSPVDLAAWPPPGSVGWMACRVWLVQAKQGGRLHPAEARALQEWAEACQGEAVWVSPGVLGHGLIWRVWRLDAAPASWRVVDLRAESARVVTP